MNAAAIADRLAAFPATLRAACAGLSRDDAMFRADGMSWSVLEIVCHLADEEEHDFPARLARTLNDPAKPWDPIDPEGWAIERRYREQTLAEQLDRFADLRARRVAWLRALRDPDWDATHEHPSLGPMRAGDLLAAWSAHDALHLRQIAKRLYELSGRDAEGYKPDYAGEWGI